MSTKFYNMREVVSYAKKKYGSRVFTSLSEYDLDPITYNQLDRFIVCFSEFLKIHQAPEMERVAVISSNNSIAVLLCVSITACDRVYVPVGASVPHVRLTDYLDCFTPGLILCDPDHVECCSSWALTNGSKVISLDGFAAFYQRIMSSVEPKPLKSKCCTSDVAAMFALSGEQHLIDKIILSQEAVFDYAYSLIRFCGLTSNDHCMVSASIDMFEVPTFASVCPLFVGASTTFIEPEAVLTNFWNVVAKNDITWAMLSPNILEALSATQPQATPLKGILISGASVSTNLIAYLESGFSIKIHQVEGLNEVMATVNKPLDREHRIINSMKNLREIPAHAFL